MTSVYPEIENLFQDNIWIKDRAILEPQIFRVDDINKKLLKSLSVNTISFKSINTNENTEDITAHHIEFLNRQTPPVIPPHKLKLKVGAPVMILGKISSSNFVQ